MPTISISLHTSTTFIAILPVIPLGRRLSTDYAGGQLLMMMVVMLVMRMPMSMPTSTWFVTPISDYDVEHVHVNCLYHFHPFPCCFVFSWLLSIISPCSGTIRFWRPTTARAIWSPGVGTLGILCSTQRVYCKKKLKFKDWKLGINFSPLTQLNSWDGDGERERERHMSAHMFLVDFDGIDGRMALMHSDCLCFRLANDWIAWVGSKWSAACFRKQICDGGWNSSLEQIVWNLALFCVRDIQRSQVHT